MGEIRSTMDIIMEKARGLTMTEEEKDRFKQEEIAGKIRGYILKFLEGSLDMGRLKSELAGAGEKDAKAARQLLAKEVRNNIEPEKDNAPLLEILEEAAGEDGAPVRSLLKEFENRLNKEKASREKRLLVALAERGFSGSAVIPNLDADEEWIRTLSEIKRLFRERLERQVEERL